MYRFDIINKLIKENNFKNYLEIGVCDPRECFDKIECENKDSVDPGVEFEENPVKYKMTSDEFFAQLKDDHPKYDVIFIDGLHLSWQVKKDIENSVKHLSDNGFFMQEKIILSMVNNMNGTEQCGRLCTGQELIGKT